MNAIALALSCVMLLAWYDTGADSYLATGNTAVPTLYIAQQLGVAALPICYAIALCMCFISTAVTSVYGLIPRFQQSLKVFQKMDSRKSAFIIALLAIVISMAFSMVGLTNVIKYGYNYCGYIGIVVIVIPFLTVGFKKNRQFFVIHLYSILPISFIGTRFLKKGIPSSFVLYVVNCVFVAKCLRSRNKQFTKQLYSSSVIIPSYCFFTVLELSISLVNGKYLPLFTGKRRGTVEIFVSFFASSTRDSSKSIKYRPFCFLVGYRLLVSVSTSVLKL